ncbi:hypothetical protein AO745_06445 [Aeromonas veronii]|nr:hypothetical protein [Aeromonas veronii]KRW08097.1 hypothetical protein AO745_06445 [Aeromonas veronii]
MSESVFEIHDWTLSVDDNVLLCALVLVALATQVLYAVVLSLGYGCFSLWRRHLRRSRQQDVLPVAK